MIALTNAKSGKNREFSRAGLLFTSVFSVNQNRKITMSRFATFTVSGLIAACALISTAHADTDAPPPVQHKKVVGAQNISSEQEHGKPVKKQGHLPKPSIAAVKNSAKCLRPSYDKSHPGECRHNGPKKHTPTH